MQTKRGAAGASVLALLALAGVPPAAYLASPDALSGLVGGLAGGLVAAYLVLAAAAATSGCAGYLEGFARVLSGPEEVEGAGGGVSWAAVMGALGAVGLAVRVWRSDEPAWRLLEVAAFLGAAAAATFLLVVVVMASGDLADLLIQRRRQAR